MAHQHLCLDHLGGFQSNAHHDDDGGAADGHVDDAGDILCDDGQQGHDTQIDGAEEGQAGEHLAQWACRDGNRE